MMDLHNQTIARWALPLFLTLGILAFDFYAMAGEPLDFPGTVITVDAAANKVAVKKDGGGPRFTFTATEKTRFQGSGVTGLKDLKKDDHIVVQYQVEGAKYQALSVTKGK
jgi:hypothetical protein